MQITNTGLANNLSVDSNTDTANTHSYLFEKLDNAPRLPIDLLRVLIEVRKCLGWHTTNLQAALEGGIGENAANAVHANIITQQGDIHVRVNECGDFANLEISTRDSVSICIDRNQMRSLLEMSKPFIPSMNDLEWTPPGLEDPFMKVDPRAENTVAEHGWPSDFVMPAGYERMGQEVMGDFMYCKELTTEPEVLFDHMIKAAFSTRVSIMGVFAANDSLGRGRVSLAINESEMTLMTFPEQKTALATLFTCGNANPRPVIDTLHTIFQAEYTRVRAMVRGNKVPFSYEGALYSDETETIWDKKAQKKSHNM